MRLRHFELGAKTRKEPRQVDLWLHHQRAQTLHQLQRRQHPHGGTVGCRLLEPVLELPVFASGESLEADGTPSAVPGQTFECFSVVFMEVSVGVKVPGRLVLGQRQARLRRGGELNVPLVLRIRQTVGEVGVCQLHRPPGDALQQSLDFLVFRRWQRGEGHVGTLEDSVGKEDVKVRMNEERAREIPDEGDRTGKWPDEALLPRTEPLEREDGADERGQHLAEQFLVLQQGDSERAGKRQGPLTPGDARQHVVHQLRRPERRPPG